MALCRYALCIWSLMSACVHLFVPKVSRCFQSTHLVMTRCALLRQILLIGFRLNQSHPLDYELIYSITSHAQFYFSCSTISEPI